MEVLAGYDSSSSTEEDKIQRKLTSKEVAEEGIHISGAASMENEPISQADETCVPPDQQEEKIEQKKESSHNSSKRRSSPSSRHRNYRKRSLSQSPDRSPERKSPEHSPSSRKRSRNSDYRDDRRHHRRSRSRSRSRSPRRRRRSPSPRHSTNERDSGRHIDEFGRDIRPEPQMASSEEKNKSGTEKDGQEQSPLHKKSLKDRVSAHEEHSPVRRGTQSPDKVEGRASPKEETRPRKSLERDSHSPRRRDSQGRRSKSPDRRRRRSRSRDRSDSRSPERRRKRDYRRSPARNSRDRRASSDYNSSRRRDRGVDRDRSRGRDGRGRGWDRERKDDRARDDRASSPSHDKKVFVKASLTGLETLPKPARPLTSEEVQAKLAAHAESLRKQAQEAASVLNMPSYINPSVVNPHQYAVQQQKRKLLWSGKKTEVTDSGSSTAKSNLWSSTKFSNDQGGEMQAKFRRLMGIKGEEGGTAAGEDSSNPQTEQLMANLEKEFERSRAFQLSRGAGGKSGIGLGYSGT